MRVFQVNTGFKIVCEFRQGRNAVKHQAGTHNIERRFVECDHAGAWQEREPCIRRELQLEISLRAGRSGFSSSRVYSASSFETGRWVETL